MFSVYCRSKVMMLPGYVQATYIQNAMKLYAHVITARSFTNNEEQETTDITEVTEALQDALKSLTSSSDLEVQERASVMQQYVKYIGKQLAKAGDSQLAPQHMEVRIC